MIIVHDTFVCKPGNASKVAKLFKEVMADNPHTVNVMTDVAGQYHRVIMVSKYDSLAAWEKHYEEMQTNPTPEMQEGMNKMEAFRDMHLGGSREFFRTW
jgi:quinol monooxygenase YgiN